VIIIIRLIKINGIVTSQLNSVVKYVSGVPPSLSYLLPGPLAALADSFLLDISSELKLSLLLTF